MWRFPKKEKDLTKLADKLGVTHDSATTSAGEDRSIMQARILAVLSEQKNVILCITALVSAIASAASAIAAWYVITKCYLCP